MTQYPIGHEFPNIYAVRTEVFKALLDGAYIQQAGGVVYRWLASGTYRYCDGWEKDCALPYIGTGPWTVVADPSEPAPKPYSEMTPEEQRDYLYALSQYRKVEIYMPEDPESGPHVIYRGEVYSINDLAAIDFALRLGAEVKKGDE